MSQENPDISIVLPFYNEEESVSTLFKRLYPFLGSLGLTYEIVCIDDGSADKTYEKLCQERSNDLRIKIIRFARNFGKEAALTCGLHHARGKGVVTMDSDLQHPPEVIVDLIKEWKKGAKMVYAIRRDRQTDGFLRRFFSKSFYALFRRIADVKLPEGAGDFRLLDRVVVNAINALPERNRFMKGIMTWVGFDYALVPFTVAEREGGATHWNFLRLLGFAFDGLTSFSTIPLRIWTGVGVLVSICSFAYGVVLIVQTMLFGIDVPGFASLMVGLTFLGGVQLLSLGMIGEYLARVFVEVKGRPIYLIADQKGISEKKEEKK